MDGIFLKSGRHTTLEQGGCAMEFVAWVAGEVHSDHPQCVSPVIGEFCRTWNDGLNDTDRQRLIPYLLDTVGTRTTQADEETRTWMCLDWLVRVHTPAWLRLAGLTGHAQALESLARYTDAAVAGRNQSVVTAAGAAVRAAAWDAAGAAVRAAAGDAAWAAAWDAAGDAARDAARAAVRAAVRAAAWDAAGDAVRAAVRAAAWDAAGDAVRDAAGAAAGAAAWDAAGDAVRDAAGAAVGDALAPTVAALQVSAFELLTALCAVGRKAEVATISERVAVVCVSGTV